MIRPVRSLVAVFTVAGMISILAPASTAAEPAAQPELTIDRLYTLPHLIGTAPSNFSWSHDERFLAFLWNDSGFNFRDVWLVDTEDPQLQPSRVTSFPQTEKPDPRSAEDPVAAAQAQEKWERDSGVSAIVWHPDGQHILASFQGDLWLVGQRATAKRLTESPGRESQPAYSPSGNVLAFLRDGELWSMGGSTVEQQRTQLSEPDLRVVGFEWSPDSSAIAVLLMDQRAVQQRGIPDYLAAETEMTQTRRAYPGEPAVQHRLGRVAAEAVAATEDQVDWLQWEGNEPDMILSYHWSPDGKQIAIDTSDLYAKDREIFVARIDDGGLLGPKRIARDLDPENETFYFWRIAWSQDSRLLYFLSDREDDYQVYAVEPTGQSEPRKLTTGDWAVAEMFPVEDGLVVMGNRGNAEERQLFRVSTNGGEPVRISRRSGTHTPTVSPEGRWAAVHFSSQGMPPDLLLTALDTQTATEKHERQVTHSPLPEFNDYRWVEAEYVTFKSHVDGTTLHGRLTLPPDLDPSRKYPVILGSVYTDSVRNQWGGRTAHPTWGLDQYLTQEGYILFNVDMRGSWGRGREHRRGIRLDYGGMDIEDLESGVRYLDTLGYVDMERVGIWGSSYGGLMTTMSLFRKPGLYAAGIAGAPATNVGHALTGQMAVMMRPQDQPEEYADSSPFVHVAGLEDPLMIIHGMRDWVVLFKDSVILTQRLILLGKDIELVALPNAGHGWDNEGLAQTRFAFHKMVEFFDRHLKDPRQECSETSHATD